MRKTSKSWNTIKEKLRSLHRLGSHISGIAFIVYEHFILASDAGWLGSRTQRGVPWDQPKGVLRFMQDRSPMGAERK